ncbi:hypothetical protein JW964_16815 [candidate division KSB1 bacterium]|nr:hypothetical protein [candidate division KSB1 bacterium]
MRNVLIADNNNFYFSIMSSIYQEHEYYVTRARSAPDAWRLIQQNGLEFYDIIVTEITIESHLSGLVLAVKLKKAGFKNPVYFASKRFNITFTYIVSTGLFRMLGIERLIPKNAFHIMNPVSLKRYLI